ncbi:MAG TPA: FxsA family protein [Longimicrobiales bacterium]|nr:FxsA family protein [Longimicrobiales bacterium]
MLARLALLFVLVPLLELVLLIQLGQWVGLLPTLALVVGTGVLGAGLARAEGLRTFRTFQRELEAGRLPGQPILDGLAVLVGGAFLLTPGLLTDLAGFTLLLPASRRWIQRRMRAWIERRLGSGEIHFRVWSSGGPPDPGTGDLDPRKEIRGTDRER